MKRLSVILWLSLLSLGAIAASGQQPAPEASREAQESEARSASDSWLALLDSAKYDDCWSQASDGLKAMAKKVDFVASLQTARKRVGKLLQRKLKASRYTTKLQGAPEGKYVIVRYDSSFESLASATEIVVPMLDKDGKWRVSGYQVDAAAPEGGEKAAQEAAQSWLALYDQGKYEDCWNQASDGLKAVAEKGQFIESLETARGRVGKIVSRKLKSSKYTTTLPGAPEGHYVVLQYESSFENLGTALEVLVPMLDKDAKWRVSGYTVK
jgi:hypothetical protein